MHAKRSWGTEKILALLFLAAACDRWSDAGHAEADLPDTAVVENVSPLWPAGQEWRISTEPVLRIGSAKADSTAQFASVAGGTRLTDGRIVVADLTAMTLRFYDPEGRYVGNAGRRGRGPGEFESIGGLTRMAGDTILIWDRRSARASIFDPEGRFVRSIQPAGLGVLPAFVGAFDDGGLVLMGGMDRSLLSGKAGIERRDTVVLLHYGPEGDFRDTIGRFAGREVYVYKNVGAITRTGIIFGRNTTFTVGGDRVVSAETGRYEVVEHTSSGRVLRRLRRRMEPREASKRDLELYRSFLLDQNFLGTPASFRAGVVARVNSLPHRATLPHLDAMLLDVDDNLWVERFRVPGSDKDAAWDVFGPDRRWLGTVQIPRNFRIFDIGRNYVLGVIKNEMDVEEVRLYRLAQPSS